MHLMELTENICKNFEDYAQAKEKKTGKPTIIRLTTPDGNMNPLVLDPLPCIYNIFLLGTIFVSHG